MISEAGIRQASVTTVRILFVSDVRAASSRTRVSQINTTASLDLSSS